MNILLIGGPSDLTNRLIASFHKEGHRVSILTGSYHGNRRFERVFEQFNFPYSSNVLAEIFQSVSPDVTVFTGIYDSNYRWRDVQKDSVSFLAAAMNILTAYSLLGKGRLLFLSSDAVFQPIHGEPISEEEEPDANDLRGMTLIEAEDLCGKFRRAYQADIITVRLSGYYSLPRDLAETTDPISQKCLKALAGGPLRGGSMRSLMPIYAPDAVFFITRMALAAEHQHELYHLSSGAVITERELEEAVNRELEQLSVPERLSSAEAALPDESAEVQALLDNRRFVREFGINRLADPASAIHEILGRMCKHRNLFLKGGEQRLSLWKRIAERGKSLGLLLLPPLENLLAFVAVFLLSRVLTGSDFFQRVDLYLLYVLLFALFYGQSQAAFSAFLAVVSLVIPIFWDRGMAKVLLDYGTYVWIAQLFIVGLSVGYLKDRLTEQKAEAMDDHEYMTNQVEDIREINGTNNRVKDALETQLINHKESLGKIYSITSSLDTYYSVDVLFHATDVIRQIMDSRDVSVYVVHEGNPYARMFTATSAHARQFGNSFLYQETGEMYEAFSQRKTYLNRTWDRNYPAMAYASYEEDQIRYIIMLWTMRLDKMTLGQANLLTIVCKLIHESVMRATRYYEAIRHTQHLPDSDVLLRSAFRRMVDFYDEAAEKQLTEFVVLRVMLLPEGLEATAMRLKDNIRPNDFVGQGLRSDALYALISNTSAEGGERVIQRLTEAGLTAVNANHELI